MQLGGLFGLTVPNLLVAGATSEDLVRLVNRINYPANAEIVSDFKTELVALANVDSIRVAKPKRVCSLPDCVLQKTWEEVSSGTDSDSLEIKFSVQDFCLQKFVESVINYERQNIRFNLPDSREGILESIENGFCGRMGSKPLGSCLTKVVNRAVQQFAVVSAPKATPRLVEEYGFKWDFPERVYVYTSRAEELEGVEFDSKQEYEEAMKEDKNVLTDLDKKLLQFFIDKRDCILDVLKQIGISSGTEQTVFGVNFEDIVHRKPTSILYVVSGQFASTKGSVKGEVLSSVCSSVRAEIDKYKELLETNVETMDEVVSLDVLTDEKYESLKGTLSENTVRVFDALFGSGVLLYSDVLASDFAYYEKIVESACCVTVDFLNEKFGESMTREEWYDEFERLCNFGLYGLNVDSEYLLMDKFPTIIVTSSVKTKMTEQNLTELKRNISDVEALLDTLVPFGVAI